eukprot:COSAG02_NODE_3295_length_6994_cov_46.367368_8_plen_369_part_00
MDKPHVNFTLGEMRDYIRQKKLNVKPITLNLSRAETIATLKKLGHWDDTVKKKTRVSKGKKDLKKADRAVRSATVSKDAEVKKAFDKYVKLHVKYIDTFDDKGLKKLKKQKKSTMNVSDMSDTLLKEIEDIRASIRNQSLFSSLVVKKVIDAQLKVKELSKNIKSRYQKISSTNKPAPKEDDVRPIDKDVPKIKKKPAAKEDDVRPVDKDVPKIKPPAKKATPQAKKPVKPSDSKSQPPTGPLVAKKDRDIYTDEFYKKYEKTFKKTAYQILKKFDKRLGSKKTAALVPMDELTKLRKKSIAKIHPDKGGDEEEFKMVNDAFDALLKSYKVDGYKSYETLLKGRYDDQRKALAEAAKAKADADKAKKN